MHDGSAETPTAQFLRDRSTRYWGGRGAWTESCGPDGRWGPTIHARAAVFVCRGGVCPRLGPTVSSACPVAAIEHSPPGITGQLCCSPAQHPSSWHKGGAIHGG